MVTIRFWQSFTRSEFFDDICHFLYVITTFLN